MIWTIKNYLLNVLIRAIIGYILFLLLLVIVFIGYIVISDWKSAIDFMNELTDNSFARIVVWLPFIFSLFKADIKASRETKKFYKQNEQFFEMYDSTGGKW